MKIFRIEKIIAPTIFLVAIISFFLLSRSFFLSFWFPITDWHGFRQTQTALTSLFFIKEGFTFNYITPVFGPPWQIPFEFPVYQWIVAALAKFSGFFLDQTGRLVSFLFYLKSVFWVILIARHFKFSWQNTLILASILLLEPTYRFWSRTFMIETTALSLSLAFVFGIMKFTDNKNWIWLAFSLFFGTLAALTKLTTFALYWLLVSAYMCYVFFITKRQADWKSWLASGLILLTPVLITVFWVKHCDALKLQDIQGSFITSKALNAWNYGTFDQKTSLKVWQKIVSNSLVNLWLLVPILLCYKLRYWLLSVFLVLVWFAGPLFFTNLYFIHDYYSCANNLLIASAFGLFLIGLSQSKLKFAPWMAFSLFIALLFWFNHQYVDYYLPKQKNFDTEIKSFGKEVQKNCAERSVVFVMGDEWNSQIPYYCNIKAVIWGFVPANEQNIEYYQKKLKDYEIAGLVVAQNSKFEPKELQNMIQSFQLDSIPNQGFEMNYGKYQFFQKSKP